MVPPCGLTARLAPSGCDQFALVEPFAERTADLFGRRHAVSLRDGFHSCEQIRIEPERCECLRRHRAECITVLYVASIILRVRERRLRNTSATTNLAAVTTGESRMRPTGRCSPRS